MNRIKRWLMDKIQPPSTSAKAVQTVNYEGHPFQQWMGYLPLETPDNKLYTSMREAVPVIDAALDKIVRLTGGFTVSCDNTAWQDVLTDFVTNVPVGATSRGLKEFTNIYLNSLLTYGNAVGEMIPREDGTGIYGLYNAKLDDVHLERGDSPMEATICTIDGNRQYQPVPHPEWVVFTPLNPPAGELLGVPLLRSLPFVSTVLMKIFQSIGSNFERVANLRYAVTYKPSSTNMDSTQANEIANTIATQWSEAMDSQKNGTIKDFVAVGDVGIQVIGADNQMIDTNVPVRQLLEQIVAKLGIPPFMLGLHWTSTERMSTQQSDILTSELGSYRFLLEHVIITICETHLRMQGSGSKVTIAWSDINLQDQIEAANVRVLRAEASLLEQELGGEENKNRND